MLSMYLVYTPFLSVSRGAYRRLYGSCHLPPSIRRWLNCIRLRFEGGYPALPRAAVARDSTLMGVVGNVERSTDGLEGADGRTERAVRVAGLHDERAALVGLGDVKADVGFRLLLHVLSIAPLDQKSRSCTFVSKVVAVHPPSFRRQNVFSLLQTYD